MITYEYLELERGKIHFGLSPAFTSVTMPDGDTTRFYKLLNRQIAFLATKMKQKKFLKKLNVIETLQLMDKVKTFRQVAAMEKVDPVVELVGKLLLEDLKKKIVIYVNFVDAVIILKMKLEAYGALHIFPGTSFEHKLRRMHKFKTMGQKRVLILSTRGPWEQIKMVNHALMLEPDWIIQNNKKCFEQISPHSKITFISTGNLDGALTHFLFKKIVGKGWGKVESVEDLL